MSLGSLLDMWILAVPLCRCVTGALFPLGHIATCSFWPGGAGRNTSAVKWNWGLIHHFLAYNFLFDHPGCAGWLAWLQGRFAVLWAEVRWGTRKKELVSTSFKDTSHCFYDQDEKEKCWSLRMEGGRYCCFLLSFYFQTSLRISLNFALFHA